jgi:hypothetical protein
MTRCKRMTSSTVLTDGICVPHFRLMTVPGILITSLSALAVEGIENRCFSSNYEDTSHFGNWVLLIKGKRSSETMDNDALQLVNHLKQTFIGTSYDLVVPS